MLAGMETGTAEEAAMFQQVKVAIRRAQERARHRRSYRALLELEDAFLRDIGLDRDEVLGRMLATPDRAGAGAPSREALRPAAGPPGPCGRGRR